MGAKTNNRIRWIHLRLSPEEYTIVRNKLDSTTARSLSEFVRGVLLDRPLVTKYRNASQDDLFEAMALLIKELNGIGNNINQSIKRLHTLRENEDAGWASVHEAHAYRLDGKLTEIKTLLNRIAERWLR